MRLCWPHGCEYSLNGEVDKRAHPILRDLGADLGTPDLLVHKPGHMSGNHDIIEVKSARADAVGTQKDLNTLSLFVRDVGYKRAIYLVYGDEIRNALIQRIRRRAANTEALAPIELWVHRKVGVPAQNLVLLTNDCEPSQSD
jgi:hypothetical protein